MTRPLRWVGAQVARAAQWLQRRRGASDDGFVLLESVVAIGMIAIIMTAVGAEFVSYISSSAEQRARQTAVQLANSAVETIRALHPSDLLTGRDAGSVNSQFTDPNVPVAVRPWLAEMSQASDPSAAPGSGATAAVPTVAVTQKPGAISYSVSQYLGLCYLTQSGENTTCAATGPLAATYLRAVVAVTWTSNGCPLNLCSYVTTTLLSTAGDPTFRINEALPPAPTVVSPGNQTSAVGEQVSLQLMVRDGTGVAPFTWAVTNGALPAGLTLSVSGLVTGPPTTIVSSLAVSMTVTDAFLRTASVSFSWTVVAALKVSAVSDRTNTTADTVSVPLAATGGTTPYAWSDPNGTLPPGLTVNSSTGVISGRPSTAGTYPVTIKVTDSGNRTATATFTWTVRAAVILANPAGQVTRVNAQASLQVAASGGTGALTYSASGLPSWLSINAATGLITGTAPAGQSVTSGITVTVTDSLNATRTSTAFSWTVTSLSVEIPDQATVRYSSASLAVDAYIAGGTGPYTVTVTGKPSWTGYNSSTHVLSGTAPGSTGSTNGITVTVTDSDGISVTDTFNWRVLYSTSLRWNTIPDQTSVPGTADSLNVTGYVNYDRAPYAATGLPPGLSINATTGVISGTPTVPGRYAVTVSATDSNGYSVPSSPFVWQVTTLALAIPDQSSRMGRSVTLDVGSPPYRTGGTGPFTYAADGLPSGLTIDSATGVISGAAASWYWQYSDQVTVTVTDSTGAQATATFTWQVTY